MTIMVEPEVEVRLQEAAKREGRAVDAIVNALLVAGLQEKERGWAETDVLSESMTARHGVKEKSLAQYIAEQRVKRGLPETWPAGDAAVEVAPGVFEVRP